VVSHTLNIPLELVAVKPSNNLTSPNGMVSGGSITSEVCAYVSTELCLCKEKISSFVSIVFCFTCVSLATVFNNCFFSYSTEQM
jgi:hypothetical protein